MPRSRWGSLGLTLTCLSLLGAEPLQNLEGTEAARTTTPPGKHAQLPRLWLVAAPLHSLDQVCPKEPGRKDPKLNVEAVREPVYW